VFKCRANIGSKSAISFQRGSVELELQVEGVALTNHSFCQNNWINDLSYGIKIWADFSSVLSQFTRLSDRQTEGRTDGRQTEFSLLDRVCIPCSAVKTFIVYST